MLFHASMVTDFFLYEYGPSPIEKSIFKEVFKFWDWSREFLNTYNFENELVSYMVHLWVDRVGAALDLQPLKNVSLQIIIDQTLTFRRIFF